MLISLMCAGHESASSILQDPFFGASLLQTAVFLPGTMAQIFTGFGRNADLLVQQLRSLLQTAVFVHGTIAQVFKAPHHPGATSGVIGTTEKMGTTDRPVWFQSLPSSNPQFLAHWPYTSKSRCFFPVQFRIQVDVYIYI
jgi:hypothetical protein